MHPGADSVKGSCDGSLVAEYVLHTLRVSRENHLIFIRVEPRIISSLGEEIVRFLVY